METAIEEVYEELSEYLHNLPHSEEYERVKKEVDKLYENLKATLNETQKKLLDDLCFEMTGFESEASKIYFIRGFNYGIRIVSEAK